MKKTRIIPAIAVALATAITGGVYVQAAQADTPTRQIEGCHSNEWYVNDDGDETARIPEQTDDGLKFVGTQLVHHKPVPEKILLRNLRPGTYEASPEPSLTSFFSVEVANVDGSAYTTLRYDRAEGKWYIGGPRGDAYKGHEADAGAFVGKKNNYGTMDETAHVLSFGVGYTRSPADGTATTVTSVKFAGNTYDLTCKAKPSPTPTEKPTEKPTTPTYPPGRTLGGPGTVSVKDVTATTVRIRWTSTPKGAVAFAVYANGKRFGTIYGHEFRFRGLKKGTTYTFSVRARGKDAGLGVQGSVKGKTKA